MGLQRVLAGVLACWLAACSGDPPPAKPGRSPVPAADGGRPATALAGRRADNPVVQPPPAQQPDAGTPVSPAVMPTGSAREPISIDETGAGNPAGLDDAAVKQLLAGGPADTLRWLYPYQGTVFPRGMLAPLLMWEGAAADAAYLQIRSRAFEYRGVLTPAVGTALGPQLQVPQAIWDLASRQTQGQDDEFTLELSVRSEGVVAGPIELRFDIAQATIKGSVYYNSYLSLLPGAAPGGNVLRIPPGGQAEVFLSGVCNGCHSVSADGSRMLSQIALASGGATFPLAAGGAANPPGDVASPRSSYGALYPDGSKYLALSSAIEVARAVLTQGVGAPPEATLYDVASGQIVPDTGIPAGALMPMFSPDGKHLVFNDFALDLAHGLAVMDYDVAADKASSYRALIHDPDSGALRPAWPFFLPDSQAVVYISTDSPDFSGGGVGLGGAVVAAPGSDLHIVDIESGKISLLARAMGYASEADAANGVSYLPFPDADLHHNYFPTVSPVAAGGYFWVFFDSVRNYGNLGVQRQLWGAAISISADGGYERDPSHPPFYLPGQEVGTGNHRAFAALDPCKGDGESCTSGIDCCGGFCAVEAGADEFSEPTGTCSPTKTECARRDERCVSDADCCPAEAGAVRDSCIAGFCALIGPQ